VVGELDTNNFGWRLELGECEFKHVDRDDQIDAPGSSPLRACAVCACACACACAAQILKFITAHTAPNTTRHDTQQQRTLRVAW
jgi:hypothetical protein